jgi:hypothetical protein
MLTGSYLVDFEARPEDRGRVHVVDVTTSRSGVTLYSARRWLPRDDALLTSTEIFDGAAMAKSASPPAGGSTPEPERPSGGRGRTPRDTPLPAPDPQLDAVLARMLEYLEIYMLDFANVVAEEDYHQRVSSASFRARSQHIRSDLLLVRTPGPDGWIPFRDVFEVNDQKVRDREDRLRKLFIDRPAPDAVQEGLRITREGARYNIGRVDRTINLPTMPLVFLMPTHLSKFQFERKGDEVVEDVPTTRLDYRELGRPTVIRQTTTNRDMPSSGSLWVDPLTGRIVKTLVRTGDEAFRVEMIVTYRRNDALGIWTPAEMNERYTMINGTETIIGEAKYSNYRRFQVSTQESITLPKDR